MGGRAHHARLTSGRSPPSKQPLAPCKSVCSRLRPVSLSAFQLASTPAAHTGLNTHPVLGCLHTERLLLSLLLQSFSIRFSWVWISWEWFRRRQLTTLWPWRMLRWRQASQMAHLTNTLPPGGPPASSWILSDSITGPGLPQGGYPSGVRMPLTAAGARLLLYCPFLEQEDPSEAL